MPKKLLDIKYWLNGSKEDFQVANNIAGRYADTKLKFYQKYNKKDYAQKYLKITEDLLLWLKKEFQKK